MPAGDFVGTGPAVSADGKTVYYGSNDKKLCVFAGWAASVTESLCRWLSLFFPVRLARYAVDAATGDVKWTYATGKDVLSSPALLGGVVIVGSYDNLVHGVDAATGAGLWTVATSGGVHAGPAVTKDGLVIVGDMTGAVMALAWPAAPAVTATEAAETSAVAAVVADVAAETVAASASAVADVAAETVAAAASAVVVAELSVAAEHKPDEL